MKPVLVIVCAALPFAQSWRPPSTADWRSARAILDDPSNRIVAMQSGQLALDLATLRHQWENTANVDCRRRISSATSSIDCDAFAAAVCPEQNDPSTHQEVAAALCRVVDGFATLVDSKRDHDVMLRVVCDDTYTARCPKFHVDKIPARAMVTLLGRGTEFLVPPTKDAVQTARELELVCLRGTKWPALKPQGAFSALLERGAGHAACEHRSPEGPPERRVFLTLDMPASRDEPEWLLRRG